MAHRSAGTLRFRAVKPVGLVDPRTGHQAYAIVQLRQDNLAGDHYSLVGFRPKSNGAGACPPAGPAKRSSCGSAWCIAIPTSTAGVLSDTWQVRSRPSLFLAGQMSGVEGYVESAASGLLAGLNAAALAKGEPAMAAPKTTAIGALAYYVSHANPAHYEPSNITFGIMPPLANPPRDKMRRKLALAERALADLEAWMAGAEAVRP